MPVLHVTLKVWRAPPRYPIAMKDGQTRYARPVTRSVLTIKKRRLRSRPGRPSNPNNRCNCDAKGSGNCVSAP